MLAAAAAALGVDVESGVTAGGGSSKADSRQQAWVQQRQQQLRQLRLLLAGMPLLQLASSSNAAGTAAAPAAAIEGTSPDSAAPAAAAASDLAAADLPVSLPSGRFNACWQLPSSTYPNLPAIEAALKGSSGNSSSLGTTPKAAQHKAAGAGAAGSRVHGSAAAGGAVWPQQDGLPAMRAKRARILKDGSLTLIPYGHDESMLWLQRVHSFIGAVRCGCRMPIAVGC